MSERQQFLIDFIKKLDSKKRHVLKITCRGNEPWEIEELSSITKIVLKSSKDRTEN